MAKSASSALLSEFFDARHYLASNPDVAASGVDPLEHWLTHGQKEGRSPAPWFDAKAYLEQAAVPAGENPFLHLLTTDMKRARDLQGSWLKTAPAVARKTKPVMQPFYALQSQAPTTADALVFTAIAGPRQALPNNTTDWPDMRVFSDTPFVDARWRFSPCLYWDANPKIIALFHKYCLASMFPDGTKLIWIDSRVSVQNSILERVIDYLDDSDLCTFRHFERDCVYDELGAILQGGRASFQEVADFERHLQEIGFPEHGGLFETGVLGMKSGPALCRVLRRTFGLSRRHIARDQVTLALALRDADISISVFNDGRTHLRNTPGVFVHPW